MYVYLHQKIYPSVFIAALFKMAKNWKLSNVHL